MELTSGNTGTGLAIVCAVKGYRFVAVVSRGNSAERARMMRALGAEVVLVDQARASLPGHVSGDDLALVEERARALTAELGAFRVDQFVRAAAASAHERHTASELWEQTGGAIDAFCDFVGTGGTLAGVTRGPKARRPAIRSYAIEPEGAAALARTPISRANHRIQGGGYAMSELPLLDGVAIDGLLTISDERAIETARRLAREEGIFAGFSSGAVVAVALDLLRARHAGGTVAVVLADSGLKYLSTDLWPA